MCLDAIALVFGKAISGVHAVQSFHLRITCRLGQNGCSRDTWLYPITADNRNGVTGQLRCVISIDQCLIRHEAQPFKCPLHGQMIRSPDVQCIYFFRAGPAYGETGGFLADENFQRLSTLFRQLLGVVQSFDWLIWVKYDSRSTYWPGPGTTPGFIYSANDEMFLHPAIMA